VDDGGSLRPAQGGSQAEQRRTKDASLPVWVSV
jgi:hypothetical protein